MLCSSIYRVAVLHLSRTEGRMVTRQGKIPFLMELSFKGEKTENKQVERYINHIVSNSNYHL